MKVLVTGANGFLGWAMVEALQRHGHHIIKAVRNQKNGCIAVGDIGINTDWQRALKGCDTVIHLAAHVPQINNHSGNQLREFVQVNTEGTIRLAYQARDEGVKRLVFVSTAKVNGEESEWPYHESDIPAPRDAYAISKWKAEQKLRALAHECDMEIVIVRPPLVYGPGVKGNFKSLVKWVQKGVPLPLGAVNNRRSLVALDNLVDFVLLCADRAKSPSAANETFLISDGSDVSTPELLNRIAHAYETHARLVAVPEQWLRLAFKLYGKSAAEGRLLGSLSLDITKARVTLGWQPCVTMDEQLLKMAHDATSS